MATAVLLGPPVVRGAHPAPDSATAETPTSHPFLDVLDANFNGPSAAELAAKTAASATETPMTRTENNSATYGSSGQLQDALKTDPLVASTRTGVYPAAASASTNGGIGTGRMAGSVAGLSVSRVRDATVEPDSGHLSSGRPARTKSARRSSTIQPVHFQARAGYLADKSHGDTVLQRSAAIFVAFKSQVNLGDILLIIQCTV